MASPECQRFSPLDGHRSDKPRPRGKTDSIVKDRPVEPFAGFAGVRFVSARLEMIVLNEIAGFVLPINYFARVEDLGLGE